MSTRSINTRHLTSEPNLRLVRAFLDEHAAALCNASRLLGGPGAERRCLRLMSSVGRAARLERHDRLELIELHRLLTLHHVGDPDRVETALFCDVDPSDARVHELCRLADGMRDLLARISEQSEAVSQALAATGLPTAA